MNSLYKVKETPFDHEILDVIKNRWSPRAFSDEPVSDTVLNSLFEAMRWAPSSMNEQPWRVIVARKGDDAHGKVVEALMSGNQPWAKEAPVLIVTVVKKTFTRNGAPNGSAKHDLGLAIGNLSIQATATGLGLHQMGGFSKTGITEAFHLPDDYEPVTVIALGHFGNPGNLPTDLQAREEAKRNRRKINEFVYYGNFEG